MPENLPAVRPQQDINSPPLRVIDNPYYEPGYAAPDDMPEIETNFEQLITPKSALAKEIAAEAVGAAKFVENLKEKKRGGSNTVTRINPYDLFVEPHFNVRDFTTEAMQKRVWELSESIATVGVEKAILVYFSNGKLCVQCGETRLRAALTAIELRSAAQVRTVPIMFGTAGENDRDRLFRQWTDNDQHQPTHLEQGLLIKKMLKFAAGDEDAEIRKIAARIGKPVIYIRTLLATQELPEEIQQHIRLGHMYPNFARSIWAKANQHLPTAISLIDNMLASAAESGNTRIMPRHMPRDERNDDTRKRSSSGGPRAGGSGRSSSRPARDARTETEIETVIGGDTGPGPEESGAAAEEPTMLAKLLSACTIVIGDDGMELFRPASAADAEMIKMLVGLHSEHETLDAATEPATHLLTDETVEDEADATIDEIDGDDEAE